MKFVLLLLLCVVGAQCQNFLTNPEDPCEAYTVLDNGLRDKACNVSDSGNTHCDAALTPRWYRVRVNGKDQDIREKYDGQDVEMLYSGYQCPDRGQCGVDNPIYLNGMLPEVSEGIVNREACVRGIDECCSETIDIKVRNCYSTYYVYYLPPTRDCRFGYCFGYSKECPNKQLTPNPLWYPTTPLRERTTPSPWRPWERTTNSLLVRTTRPYWEGTTRPYWDRTTRPYWDRTTRPYWEGTTRPYWDRTTRPYWDRTTRPYWERTTRPYWDRTTRPWWDRTTRPYWDRTTRPYWERTTRPWWDRTTRPYWERTTQPYWERTTRPWWDRTTRPYWERTTRPYWERTTRPWWDRTTRPYWERTTRPWWDRTTRPYWERTTRPWWDRTTRPWWERTTRPWWDTTTRPWWRSTSWPPYTTRNPFELWSRRYHKLVHISAMNSIMSSVAVVLLFVVIGILLIPFVRSCCRRKIPRANNYYSISDKMRI